MFGRRERKMESESGRSPRWEMMKKKNVISFMMFGVTRRKESKHFSLVLYRNRREMKK